MLIENTVISNDNDPPSEGSASNSALKACPLSVLSSAFLIVKSYFLLPGRTAFAIKASVV